MQSEPLILPLSASFIVDTSSHLGVADLIRRRAYELFEARGSRPGHDVDDWLKAEREVLGEPQDNRRMENKKA